jgi:hypothetical protein
MAKSIGPQHYRHQPNSSPQSVVDLMRVQELDEVSDRESEVEDAKEYDSPP